MTYGTSNNGLFYIGFSFSIQKICSDGSDAVFVTLYRPAGGVITGLAATTVTAQEVISSYRQPIVVMVVAVAGKVVMMMAVFGGNEGGDGIGRWG